MAKKSKIAKAKKQMAMIEKYADKRQELKAAGDRTALAKLPRDSNPNRLRHRDKKHCRPRGYMRKSRIKFRELAHQGLIPGVKKASW